MLGFILHYGERPMMKGERTKTLVKSHCCKVLKVEDIRRCTVSNILSLTAACMHCQLELIIIIFFFGLFCYAFRIFSSFYTELCAVSMILEAVMSCLRVGLLFDLKRHSLAIIV